MPNKPSWTEGILLSQHHFQQQDRYHESLLRDRLQAITHYDWGVTELELDDRGLASGQFKVRRFAAIWPDGTSGAGSIGMRVGPVRVNSSGARSWETPERRGKSQS